MSRAFFDSNVLIYGFIANDPRSETARSLIRAGGGISVQCLNEFANVARRKFMLELHRIQEMSSLIAEMCDPIVPVDLALHHHGLALAERYGFSIYDSMIVSAALRAESDLLYSEDMHDGLVVDGHLTIVNPFR